MVKEYPKNCYVNNCDRRAYYFVDDDGVDTWLCEKHYAQLIKFREKLPKWRGKIMYVLHILIPTTTGTRITYIKIVNNRMVYCRRSEATRFDSYESAEKQRSELSQIPFFDVTNISIMEVLK